MNWITASIIMLIGSVGMYLVLRRSNQLKTDSSWNNLTFFLFPAVFFTILAIILKTDLRISWQILAIIIFVKSFLFQFVSSISSLKSISLAPNPGYSLVISKSYAVMTVILSYFLFNSPVTPIKFLAILAILVLCALLSIDPDKTMGQGTKMWFWLALIPFFFWGFDSILSKYLLNSGVNVMALLVYGCWSVTFISIVSMSKKKIGKPNKTQLINLMIMGLFTCIFYYFRQTGVMLAPNMGYVNAISTASIPLVTLGSAIIFKDKLTPLKFGYILGIIIAMGVLVI